MSENIENELSNELLQSCLNDDPFLSVLNSPDLHACPLPVASVRTPNDFQFPCILMSNDTLYRKTIKYLCQCQ